MAYPSTPEWRKQLRIHGRQRAMSRPPLRRERRYDTHHMKQTIANDVHHWDRGEPTLDGFEGVMSTTLEAVEPIYKHLRYCGHVRASRAEEAAYENSHPAPITIQ